MLTLYQKTNFLSEFKAFAGDKINVTENLKFVVLRVDNILGKGENAGFQHFLLFHIVFKRLLFQRHSKGLFFKVIKSQDCVVIEIMLKMAQDRQ